MHEARGHVLIFMKACLEMQALTDIVLNELGVGILYSSF